MKTYNPAALNKFTGLKKALKTLTELHSYTLDLGFALGILKQSRAKAVSFHVDASGYRPAKLTPEEWHEITNISRFHVRPRYKKGDVFHSKGWFFRKGLLLGSANLSVQEARENLNFWCWMPGVNGAEMRKLLQGNGPATLIWDLSKSAPKLRITPIKAVREAIGHNKISNLVVITPQPPNKKMLKQVLLNGIQDGTCIFFLNNETHTIAELPGKAKWQVHNYVPQNRSIGLHGKALYAEWGKGPDQGAVLYLGSANFTKTAYSGDNIESGIVFKAEGAEATKDLQDAIRALLGKKTVSNTEESWATERFNGTWERVDAVDDEATTKKPPFRSEEDLALAQFIEELERRTKNNCLVFPPKYDHKFIIRAELTASELKTSIWAKRSKTRRRFSGVIWSPGLTLKVTLGGGREEQIIIPPFEGLMTGIRKGVGLLELLLAQSPGNGWRNGGDRESGDAGLISVYGNDSRVLFPWRAISRNGYSNLMRNKSELKRALNSIDDKLGETDSAEDAHRLRKLQNIAFTLKCLLNLKK